MQSYWKKYEEALYNLSEVKRSFAKGETSFEHCLNNYLSSVQSVFWVLNTKFSANKSYEDWQKSRTQRLPKYAKVFKELRNISLKEYPLEHSGIINGFDFGAVGITIPPHAEVLCPVLDTYTGKLVSNKATIKLVDGTSYEVEPLIIRDFAVNGISDGKSYNIDFFLKRADEYMGFVKREIATAENRFK